MSLSVLAPEPHQPGFVFTNAFRNLSLEKKGFTAPNVTKTGTTIAGCVFKDGVILAADSRATNGPTVADKECEKLSKLAPNMYCAGAGTAADMDKTSSKIAGQLELHRLNTGRVVPVVCAVTLMKRLLHKYQGHISAYFIVGGVDSTGPHLYQIAAHGSVMKNPFMTTGSGCLAAMSVLETQWKPDMEEADAKRMMIEAISAGIFNDMGSGSSIGLVILKKDSVQYSFPLPIAVKGERIIVPPGKKAEQQEPRVLGTYRYKKGTTAVLSTKTIPLVVEATHVRHLPSAAEAMETS
jgi:20S proteasome subunit beta 2